MIYCEKYFKRHETACECCGDNHMDAGFMLELGMLRHECQFPFIVTSGYRCKKRNEEVGGKPNSTHLKGYAVDIKLPSNTADMHKLLKSATAMSFNIGIYPESIHLDIRLDESKNYCWIKHDYNKG